MIPVIVKKIKKLLTEITLKNTSPRHNCYTHSLTRVSCQEQYDHGFPDKNQMEPVICLLHGLEVNPKCGVGEQQQPSLLCVSWFVLFPNGTRYVAVFHFLRCRPSFIFNLKRMPCFSFSLSTQSEWSRLRKRACMSWCMRSLSPFPTVQTNELRWRDGFAVLIT